MVEIASVSDVVSISQRQAVQAGQALVGITASVPAYVQVPDASDPDAVWEWVVDVRLLDGITQAIVSDDPGLATIENVLINHEASGSLVGDINVPVEMRKSKTGQLQVVGRAKVHLPDLRLDTYTYEDLQMGHCAGTSIRSDGVTVDNFGAPVVQKPAAPTYTVAIVQEIKRWDSFEDGDGWGSQQWGATEVKATRTFAVNAHETITITESKGVV
jgi:hypothetical protein